MPVIVKFRHLEYCQNLIHQGFKHFIDIHVKCFENYRDAEVNFVGSVAHLFENELHETCASEGLKVGAIIQRPLENLVQFHLNQSKEKIV
jgi:hypothetical protein